MLTNCYEKMNKKSNFEQPDRTAYGGFGNWSATNPSSVGPSGPLGSSSTAQPSPNSEKSTLSNHVTPRKRKTHLYVIYNFINFGHAYGGFGKVDRRAATILTFSRLLSVVGRLLRNEFQLSATLRPRNVIALESQWIAFNATNCKVVAHSG